MDIKPIIVRDYLESLTESEELDSLIPIFLETRGFVILSKPKEYKGFPQYGKDIVAVGVDLQDGIRKKFYFEIKGGEDRHITTTTFQKTDGIRESLIEAKYTDFNSSYPNFKHLPLKIILAHNGEIHANVKETYEGFIKKEFPSEKEIQYERWGLSELTQLFSEYLFGEFLLTDERSTKLFNRVLVNLNVNDKISIDYVELINDLFSKIKPLKNEKSIPRKWKLLFQSLKLISFIIYTESKEYNNLEITKRYLTHLIMVYWHWILKNKLENNDKVKEYFATTFIFFHNTLQEYFIRTLEIAALKDGLYSEEAGRYEQIGYTKRTFEYLEFLMYFINAEQCIKDDFDIEACYRLIMDIIKKNDVSARPLLDIHSIPIIDILNFLVQAGKFEDAKEYLLSVLGYIHYGKNMHDRLPDANNSIENVLKFVVTGTKPIYYSDSTSPLITVLMEYLAYFDLEDMYIKTRDFVLKHNIDLGIFVPHHGIKSVSKDLIEDAMNDLEEQLFSKSFSDGYQSNVRLIDDMGNPLSFEDFKAKIRNIKDEFEYVYRTNEAGFPFLLSLAHINFITPYFPDKWRSVFNVEI